MNIKTNNHVEVEICPHVLQKNRAILRVNHIMGHKNGDLRGRWMLILFWLWNSQSNTHLDKILKFVCICIADIYNFVKMVKLSPSWKTIGSIQTRIWAKNSQTKQITAPTECQPLVVHLAQFPWYIFEEQARDAFLQAHGHEHAFHLRILLGVGLRSTQS